MPTIFYMRRCVKCRKYFSPSSRHVDCPSCRAKFYRRPCPNCGKLIDRKSKICKSCFYKSKQYPISKKKHKNKNGYIYVYFKNHPYSDKTGRVFEHRIVMEKKLGRYLFPFENIHHRNGVKSDNRLTNLELWTKPQPIGVRVKDVVKWAQDILKLYDNYS